MYVRLSIFTPVFVVSLMELDGLTSSFLPKKYAIN